MIEHLRRRTYTILDVAEAGDLTSRVVDLTIIVLILLSVVAVVLESMPDLAAAWKVEFHAFDLFVGIVFTAEYILRLWSCTADPRLRRPVRDRLRFATRPLIVVDLLAILPFLLPMFFAIDLRMLRMLRVFRLLRLFKLARYSRALRLLGTVVNAKKEEMIVALMIMLMVMVFSAALMHAVEHEVQPEAFSSIPAAMWWAVATLTTVGYGDVYPITPLGRLVGAVMAMVGIGMFAVPAGLLAQGFAEQIEPRRATTATTCPHCGGALEGRTPPPEAGSDHAETGRGQTPTDAAT